jgi:hypothetical protein
MEGELRWKAIEERNLAIKWGEFADSAASSEDGWPGVPSDAKWPSHSEGNLYFGELDEDTRDRMVWDAIDRRRGEEEDMHLLKEDRCRADEVEFRSYYEDDTF